MHTLKKLFAIGLFTIQTTSLAFNNIKDETFKSYETLYDIEFASINIPTLVEFDLDLQKYPILIVDEQKIGFGYNQNKILESDNFKTSSLKNITNLEHLTDGNFQTKTHFNIEKTQGETVLNFKTKDSHTYHNLRLFYEIFSKPANHIKIEAKINQEFQTIFAKSRLKSDNINFPKTTTSEFRITLNHKHPIILNQIKFQRSQELQALYNKYQFLAVPGKSFKIYSDADQNPKYKVPETGYFNQSQSILKATFKNKTTNPLYSAADNDADGIIDKEDNCPFIKNTEQSDINQNEIGDVCEDFDGDSIINSKDNCPNQANRNQKDQDQDGKGDICDTEESRITERLPWLQWLSLAITAGIIIWLVIKKPK